MRVQRYLILAAFSLAAACVQLGLVTPQTFDEKLTAAVSTVTALRDVTTNLLLAKKIGSADAEHIAEQLTNARAGLDIARSMKTLDPKTAEGKLTTITTSLTALRAYLVSKGGGS